MVRESHSDTASVKGKHAQSSTFAKHILENNHNYYEEENRVVVHREGFGRRFNAPESLEIYLSYKTPEINILNQQKQADYSPIFNTFHTSYNKNIS